MRRLALLIAFVAIAPLVHAQGRDIRITAITPSFGPTAGGTEVVITGTGFLRCDLPSCFPLTTHLTIGGISVPYEETDTAVRFTTPPHPPGEVEVLFQPLMGGVLRTTFLYTDAETIPTLSEWALLLLAALLAAVAVYRIG